MSRARDLADRVLHNRTHEDTEGGRESIVTFKGEQSGGEISTLAQIQASHDGTADDEKADLIFKTNDGNDGVSPTERMRIDSDGDILFAGSLNKTAGTGSFSIETSGSSSANLTASSSMKFTAATGGGSDSHQFINNTTEAMRIDSNGNVGIGQSSPSYKLTVKVDSGGDNLRLENGSELAFIRVEDSGDLNLWAHGSENILFKNGTGSGSERMRINSSGYFGLGRSDPVQMLDVYNGSNNQWVCRLRADKSNPQYFLLFDHASSSIGSVTGNNSSVTYSTSSDYRLKENVRDITDGITRVKQLSPKRFNFIVDADTTVDGFLAHEAQTVVPEAVVGTKDAMTEEVLYVDGDEIPDGKKVGDVKTASKIEPQGIDQGKLVPLLTAALQEAIAKIETLETKVAALEG